VLCSRARSCNACASKSKHTPNRGLQPQSNNWNARFQHPWKQVKVCACALVSAHSCTAQKMANIYANNKGWAVLAAVPESIAASLRRAWWSGRQMYGSPGELPVRGSPLRKEHRLSTSSHRLRQRQTVCLSCACNTREM
jgi:hypothetical protein